MTVFPRMRIIERNGRQAGGKGRGTMYHTMTIAGLRREARQKLAAIRPHNLGQASRVSGVSPADVAVLMVYLKQNGGV